MAVAGFSETVRRPLLLVLAGERRGETINAVVVDCPATRTLAPTMASFQRDSRIIMVVTLSDERMMKLFANWDCCFVLFFKDIKNKSLRGDI